MRICTWNVQLGRRLDAVLRAVRTHPDFETVVRDMAARPQVPLTLVAGDLNTFGPPRLQLWRRIRAAAKAAGLVELTRGIRRTHWTSQKLDAVYARAEAAFEHRAWSIKVRASDHLPVFAEMDIRTPGRR